MRLNSGVSSRADKTAARARVLVRRVVELPAATTEALDFLDYDFAGKRVWVKPNLLGPHRPEDGVTTDPELIRHVVRELKRRGATARVFDNPGGSLTDNIEKYLEPTGAIEASEGAFHSTDAPPGRLKLRSRFLADVPVSSLLFETDVILNLPVFKTHALTLLTGAIKNLFGVIPGGQKSRLHQLCPSPPDFAELVVDIFAALPVPVLSIMDATRGMDGQNGPAGGRVLKLGCLLASSNAVALDSVMALMAGTRPDRIPHIRIAGERKLGPIRKEEITIAGDYERVHGFRMPSRLVAAAAGHALGLVYYRLGRHRPVLTESRCVRCRRCADGCPVQAIEMKPYPVLDRRICISCYCCAELCPERALEVPSPARSLLLNMLGR